MPPACAALVNDCLDETSAPDDPEACSDLRQCILHPIVLDPAIGFHHQELGDVVVLGE